METYSSNSLLAAPIISRVDLTYPDSPILTIAVQQPAINAPGRDPAIDGDAYTPPSTI